MSSFDNYWEAWGLACDPFDPAPGTSNFYLSAAAEGALTLLYFTLRRSRGAATFTGPQGSGKTTVLTELKQTLLNEGLNPHCLSLAGLSSTQVLREICTKLELYTDLGNPKVMRQSVHIHLLEQLDLGIPTYFLLDDCDQIQDDEAIHLLHELTEARVDGKYLCSLILTGRRPLLDMVANYPKLFTRLAFQARLETLAAVELEPYLGERLRAAGWTSPELPLTREAMDLLYRRSAGVPGEVNRLMAEAMRADGCQELGLVDTFYLFDNFEIGAKTA